MQSVEENVALNVEDGIAVLTLNRPGSMNAMSRKMMSALEHQLEALAAMSELRVVVITGSGRAFSAGGDLVEFEQELTTDKSMLIDTLRYNQDVLQMVEDLPVPVIAAINGFAVAGGLELLLCCDILIAVEGAKIGDGHAQYGVVPAGGATVRLCERIAPSLAAQLFYTAKLVDAETLVQWGLVNEVVARDQLMDRAMEIARDISRCSPQALRHIKVLTHSREQSAGRQERIRAELERFTIHVGGPDLQTGLAAFRAKLAPEY